MFVSTEVVELLDSITIYMAINNALYEIVCFHEVYCSEVCGVKGLYLSAKFHVFQCCSEWNRKKKKKSTHFSLTYLPAILHKL